MGASSGTTSKIVVLMGGPSAERDVSLATGKACAKALRDEGFEVTELDASADIAARLAVLRPDVVFNALHGPLGEDGCVQGLLEWMQIPYTHSGVLASAMSMDKIRTKQMFASVGLPVAASVLAEADTVRARHVMAPPYVVKPYNEGSSVGVYLVMEGANTPPQLSADMPQIVMVEEYVPGRELTCSVMGDRALPVTDIITNGWYDYSAKYDVGGSRHVVPAQIPDEITKACQDYALRAHRVMGCRGVTRTDFRWDEARGLAGLILLEINTQPGMTPTSLVPEQAAAVGITMGQLCRWIVEDASCSR